MEDWPEKQVSAGELAFVDGSAVVVGSAMETSCARTMPVVEKFVSVNGEGRQAGRLAAFVRFAGCNLRCSYCDTMWANEADVPAERLTVGQIAEWAQGTPASCVTLTGGEPALQPLLPQLVRALLSLPPAADGAGGLAARTVEIETNGSVDLSAFATLRREEACGAFDAGLSGVSRQDEAHAQAAGFDGAHSADCGSDEGGAGCAGGTRGIGCSNKARAGSRLRLTMDWKLPSSGMERSMRAENLALLGREDTVKFVAGSRSDLEEMERVVRAHELCDACAVYVSPVFGSINPAEIVEFLSERRLARVVLQLQLHKIIWPNVEKGV